MHCVVAWNVRPSIGTGRQVGDALRGCLRGYSWVRTLQSVYIVQVQDQDDWLALRTELIAVARAHPKSVNIIISPPMEGGAYAGWLPKRLWAPIRKRVE